MDGHTEREPDVIAVVGLGNPGKQYEATRHNVGFRVVDQITRRFGVTLQERGFPASWGTGMIEGRKVLFIKPSTFMNRSGEAVGPLLEYFEASFSQALVIHDDLDLPCGRIRLARGGGSGGHRGVSSIKQHAADQDFPRLKLGIGRPLMGEPIEAYVLESPYPEQEKLFEEMTVRGAEVVQVVLTMGLAAAMNRFNRKDFADEGIL